MSRPNFAAVAAIADAALAKLPEDVDPEFVSVMRHRPEVPYIALGADDFLRAFAGEAVTWSRDRDSENWRLDRDGVTYRASRYGCDVKVPETTVVLPAAEDDRPSPDVALPVSA